MFCILCSFLFSLCLYFVLRSTSVLRLSLPVCCWYGNLHRFWAAECWYALVYNIFSVVLHVQRVHLKWRSKTMLPRMTANWGHICAPYVTSGLHGSTLWTVTQESIPAKTYICVRYVGERLLATHTCTRIWMCTEENTGARSAENVFRTANVWRCTSEPIPERNRTSVATAVDDFRASRVLGFTVEFTAARDRIGVTCARKRSGSFTT